MIKTIKDLAVNQIKSKKILMRVDFNVPQDKDLNITDDSRIQAALPSIKYLIEKGARLILVTHLGRPKNGPDDRFKLDPVAKRLSELLGFEVKKLHDSIGKEVEDEVNKLTDGQVCLLENIRFYKEEEENDQNFCKKLAALADVYVNDAFGTAHRAHASTAGVASYLNPAVAGLLMEKEVAMLGSKLDNPERPFTAIIGGSKISSKIAVLNTLVKKVDTLIIGGGMAYTFLKARGASIGKSICEDSQLEVARHICALADENNTAILLPEDVIGTPAIDAEGNEINIFDKYGREDKFETKVLEADRIPSNWQGMDIGPETRIKFSNLISQSKTVLWNGPVGVFEYAMFDEGTKDIAIALMNLTAKGGATIIGGGDSVAAIEKYGFAKEKFTHVSTGGGASLEFLEGQVLPGIDCLNKKDAGSESNDAVKPAHKSFAEELKSLENV